MDTTVQNEDGETALLLASKRGHNDVVRMLLSTAGASSVINKCDARGASPLLLSVAGGHADVMLALLSVPSRSVDAADRFGCTPLSVAASAGRAELVGPLLASGYAPTDPPGSPPSILAPSLRASLPAAVQLLTLPYLRSCTPAAGSCVRVTERVSTTRTMPKRRP